MDRPTQLKALIDLDARHDELLERLDALDRQVQGVLAWCGGRCTCHPGGCSPRHGSACACRSQAAQTPP